jgi:hypothetical protein
MITAQHGDYDMAWLLLDKGADPGIRNEGGLHALALAVIYGDEDLVELLIESGADINQDINASTNPLNLAKEAGNEEMVLYLEANGARPNRRPEVSEIRGGLDMNFNMDDFMMGFEAGVSESKYNLYLTTGFLARPAAIRILHPENDTLSFQFWEKRRTWPLSLGKEFELLTYDNGRIGARVHLTGALTWGGYRGSARNPDTRYLVEPGAGIYWREKYFGITFDYQFVRLKVQRISSHRFKLAIIGYFNFRQRTRYAWKDISWF